MLITDETAIATVYHEELVTAIGSLTIRILSRCKAGRISGLDTLLKQRQELLVKLNRIGKRLLIKAGESARGCQRQGVSMPPGIRNLQQSHRTFLFTLEKHNCRIRKELESIRQTTKNDHQTVCKRLRTSGLYGRPKQKTPQYVSMCT